MASGFGGVAELLQQGAGELHRSLAVDHEQNLTTAAQVAGICTGNETIRPHSRSSES
jgi:hypothetical protein